MEGGLGGFTCNPFKQPAVSLVIARHLHHHHHDHDHDRDDDDDDDDGDDYDDANLNSGDPVPPQCCHTHNSQSSASIVQSSKR